MTQLIIRFPLGLTLVNGKPVDNTKIANDLCDKFDSGASIAVPSGKYEDGTPIWDLILVEQDLEDEYTWDISIADNRNVLSSSEVETCCEACLPPVGDDRVMVDDLVYLCPSCNKE
jgi:hypothetical protein